MPEDSPSATPRLNQPAARVEIVSKMFFRERSSERLEDIISYNVVEAICYIILVGIEKFS